jgi:hypothetical protein
MKRCLFIFPNAPLASDFSGGASRYLTSYQALNQLGVEMHVWRAVSANLVEQIAFH